MNLAGASDAPGVEIIQRARALRPLLAAEADAIERDRQLTPNIVAALTEGGFYKLLLPKSIGGAEVPPGVFLGVLEEIGQGDASAAWCLAQCGVCAMVAAYLDPAIAHEMFDAPHAVLAWGATAGEAQAVSGGYRVTWRWHFASGSRQATWIGAHVQIVEPDGKKRLKPDGKPAVRTILFPRKSAIFHDVWDVVGLKGTGTDDYAVDNLFVPEKYSALRDDPSEQRESGPLYKISGSIMYGLSFAAIALGVARATLDAAIEIARGKQSRDLKTGMKHNNVVQATIGRGEAKLRGVRAYLFGTLDEVWRALEAGQPLTTDHRLALRLASTWTIHQAAEVVDAAYHMAGATAVFHAQPFERRFRDIHAIAQQIQARDLHYESVGQVLLGLDPDATVFAT
ncbi:MAG TPA: acyl-CoA dehydrogenase family protein [Stellaceae bacterium]|jgi:alkylation response protein AidB-like acyl-CoA dehydrogenase|nr:acyl-CoA dehydrogenase family protein [Stellaceae bacterium]